MQILSSNRSDPVIKAWRKQFYGDKERIRLTDLKEFIEKDIESGRSFIINFLVAFVTIMINGPAMGTCNQKFLENIKEDVSVKDLDWCGFLIESLKQSKRNFKMDRSSQFAGPVAFLVLLYLHCTKVNSKSEVKKFPALCYLDPDKVKVRLKDCINKGGYDKVKVVESYESFVEGDNEHMPYDAD